jgi:hypothetical protein
MFSGFRGLSGGGFAAAGGLPRGQEQTVGMVSMFVHAVGEPMAVEVNFKTGEMMVDKQAEAEILRRQAQSYRADSS